MKIYLDCGTHLGEGITSHIDIWNIDQNWRIIGFEANPFTFKKLMELKASRQYSERFTWLSNMNLELHQKAVWTKDGKIEIGCAQYEFDDLEDIQIQEFLNNHDSLLTSGFLLADHVNNANPIDGASSLYPKQMHRFLSRYGDSVQRRIRYSKVVETECFDFSNFLAEEFDDNDEIFCKMDIERSEFKVLEHCIKNGTISKIKVLDIEWHDYRNIFYRLRKIRIKYYLKKFGVKVNEWK